MVFFSLSSKLPWQPVQFSAVQIRHHLHVSILTQCFSGPCQLVPIAAAARAACVHPHLSPRVENGRCLRGSHQWAAVVHVEHKRPRLGQTLCANAAALCPAVLACSLVFVLNITHTASPIPSFWGKNLEWLLVMLRNLRVTAWGKKGWGGFNWAKIFQNLFGERGKKQTDPPEPLFAEQLLPCSEEPEPLRPGSFISSPELISYGGASQVSAIAAPVWAPQLD